MFTETGRRRKRRMGTHPWASLKRYIDNSPFSTPNASYTPLLLLHGAADAACPVEQARMMYSALERLGKTVQFAEYAARGMSSENGLSTTPSTHIGEFSIFWKSIWPRVE
jgi:dipeptidyl aminopeptidase/acylaminoacyl peptidase